MTETSAGPAVRPATPSDAEPLTRLINAAYEVERHFVRGQRIAAPGVLDLISKGTFLTLPAAASRAGIDGCVYLEPRGEVAYLGLLSVAPDRQGEGLGHLLLTAGEDWLSRGGARTVEILVVDLRTELFPWYRKRGYRRVGTRPFVDVERLLRPCHFVVLQKALEPDGST